MPTLLTAKQILLIEHLATLDGLVELYEDDSLNGMSWTLRYKHSWASPGAVYPRSESHMIFAVRKPDTAGEDAAAYAAKMKPRVAAAKQLFLAATARRKK